MAKKKKSPGKRRKKKGRLNTRLLMIIGLSAVIVGGIGAGLIFLRVKGSVSRNLHAGAAFIEEGNWNKAERAFGRVIRKDPSNDAGIAGLLEVYDHWVPTTREHAQDLRRQFFAVVVHDMRYHPGDDQRAIRAMDLAYQDARALGGTAPWTVLADLCETVKREFAPGSPAANQALYFSALSRLATETERFTSERDNQGNVIFPGETELVAYLQAVPNDDDGMAQLAFGRMAVARRLGLEEQFQQEAKNLELAESTYQEALAANPQGPATLLSYVRHLILHDLVSASREERQVGTLTNEEQEAVLKELAMRLDEVEQVLRNGDAIDSYHLADFVQFVRVGDRENGQQRAVDLIQLYLKDHPDDDLRRLELAEGLRALDENDAALEQIQRVLGADDRSVAHGASRQYLIKALASKVLFDTAADAWATADDADKPGMLAEARSARDQLVVHLQGDEGNSMVTEADGRLAFMDGDMRAAAATLERLAVGGGASPLLLRINAVALEEIGQPGLAAERLSAAVTARPGSVMNRMLLASLYGRMGEPLKGIQVLDVIPASMRNEREDLRALYASLQAMHIAAGGGDTSLVNDPVLQALTQADALQKDGRRAEAVSLLEETIVEHGDKENVLAAIVAAARLHAQGGANERAKELIARARTIRPDDTRLVQLEYALSIEDPIERLHNYAQQQIDDPDQRIRQLLLSFEVFAAEQKIEAQRLNRAGDREGEAAALALHERANAEIETLKQQAAGLTDDSAGTFLLRFRAALQDGDFDTAEGMLSEARTANHDQAGGHLLESELLFSRFRAATEAGAPEASQFGQRAVAEARLATQEAGWNNSTWRNLGRVLHLTGDLPEARLAWAEAWRRDPSDASAARAYAQLMLLEGGDPALAARVLRQAARDNRGNATLVEDWLSVETAHGDQSLAVAERRQLLKANPGNRSNALRLAGLLVSMEPTFDRIALEDTGGTITARQWLALNAEEQAAVLAEARANWAVEAGGIVDDLAAGSDQNMDLLLMHASVLNELGRTQDMFDRLNAFIDRASADPERDEQLEILSAAQFLLEADRAADAVRFMRARVDRQEADAGIDAAIGGLLAAMGDAASAEPHLRNAVAAGDTASASRLVEVLLQLQRLDAARTEYGRVQERAPAAYETAMLEALIARAEQGQAEINNDAAAIKAAQAKYRAALEEASRRDPGQVAPYLELVSSLIREYRRTIDRQVLEQALRYADAAAEVNPDVSSLVVQRALVMEALGEPRRAATDLETFLRRNPGADEVRVALAQMHVAAGTPERASRVLNDAIANGRNPSAWRDRLATHLMQHHGDRMEASRLVANAWADEPTNERLAEMRRMTLTHEPWAFEAVYKALQLHGERFAEDSRVRGLQARAEAAQGLRDNARASMREAWLLGQKNEPGAYVPTMSWFEDLSVVFRPNEGAAGDAFIEAVVGTAQAPAVAMGRAHYLTLRANPGDYQAAIELLQAALPDTQDTIRLRTLNQLGSVQLRSGTDANAVETFREIVRIDNLNPAAYNNLAWLLATTLDKADEALPLARRAVELAPMQPSFLDTLTEVYVRQGDVDGAMTTRLSQLRLQPNNPELLTQIAEGYLDDLDDAAAARPYAERALELSPQDAAALALAGWVDFKAGKAARAEDRLKQSIRRKPTADGHLRLAQILAANGRLSQAQDHLRQAEALADDPAHVEQIKAVRADLEAEG